MPTSLQDELAEFRSRVKLPTDSELIESARWMIEHPDCGSIRPMLKALLTEIDRLRALCRSRLKIV